MRVEVGDHFTTIKGETYEILAKPDGKGRYPILFHKTGGVGSTIKKYIIKGTPIDPLAPSVFGVGYLGKGKYKSRVLGKKERAYSLWENMMSRCYYTKNRRYSSYGGVGVRVLDEWKNYQVFAEWFHKNYLEGFFLDKDLFGEGLLYSENTCVFIPRSLNNVLMIKKKEGAREGLPMGVHKGKVGFVAATVEKKVSYPTAEEAKHAYLKHKRGIIMEEANRVFKKGEISSEIYNQCEKVANSIRYAADGRTITWY